nr:DUF4349 domain-containing protein [uncultured Niameybacter sp.]
MRKKSRILLIIFLIGISVLFSACASKNATSMMESTTSEAPQAPMEESKEEMNFDMEVTQEQSGSGNIQFDTTNKLNRKIIKTGTINLQTKTFEESVQGVIDEVNALGGFIQNCSIEGNNLYSTYRRRAANLSVRIPNNVFDTFMNESNQFGNITSKSIQGEDVTNQYMDTEIRLSTLEIQAERLKELLKQAGDLDKLFRIEKELGNVTYEIESLKGTLKKYDSLIDYSTIEIYIEEADVYIEPIKEDTFLDRVKNTFIKSFKGLISVIQTICLIIVAIIPFLIILVPIIIIGIKILSYRNKKRKKHSQDE